MSRENIAEKISDLCVGTTAMAFGDPSGSYLMLAPLAAIATTLGMKKNTKLDALIRRSQKRVLKELRDFKDVSEQDLLRVSTALSETQDITELSTPFLREAIASGEYVSVTSSELAKLLFPSADQSAERTIAKQVLKVSLEVCMQDIEFLETLSRELVIDIRRSQIEHLRLTNDINLSVKLIKGMLVDNGKASLLSLSDKQVDETDTEKRWAGCARKLGGFVHAAIGDELRGVEIEFSGEPGNADQRVLSARVFEGFAFYVDFFPAKGGNSWNIADLKQKEITFRSTTIHDVNSLFTGYIKATAYTESRQISFAMGRGSDNNDYLLQVGGHNLRVAVDNDIYIIWSATGIAKKELADEFARIMDCAIGFHLFDWDMGGLALLRAESSKRVREKIVSGGIFRPLYQKALQ